MFKEIQSTGRQNINLERISRSGIRLGNTTYEVYENGLHESLQGGDVRVDVVNFRDPDLAKDMDAAFIWIKSRKSTPIQSWLGERIFIEAVQSGSGVWVGVTPWGEVVTHQFDGDRNDNGLIAYGAGWIGSWVAGRHGLSIVEVCVPAFTEDGTTLVAEVGDERIGNLAIPQAFQALYMSLMGLDGR